MPSRVPIDGRVLAELREDRFWGHGQLAERAQAFAKTQHEVCALSRTQVIGYEAARLEDPQSRYPSRENLRYLVGALRPTMAALGRLVGRDPPSGLAQWASDTVKPAGPAGVNPHAPGEPVEQAGTTAPNSEEPAVDRREFAIKLPAAVAAYVALPAAVAAYVALPAVADPLRAEVDALTGAYATTPPQRLLPRARRLSGQDRARLGRADADWGAAPAARGRLRGRRRGRVDGAVRGPSRRRGRLFRPGGEVRGRVGGRPGAGVRVGLGGGHARRRVGQRGQRHRVGAAAGR
ncbi:MAG: hypothetical protein ACRD0K_13980 [Egibacteraceae bacterium]